MSVSINGTGSITGIDQGFNVTSGSVGIGTDNPSHELDIESVSPTIELRDSDNDYKFQLTQSGSATYVDFDTDGGGSSSLRIRNAYDEKVRIQSNGNTGIGTNDPGSNKLQVQGSSAFYGNGGASATWGDTSYLGALSFDGSAQPVIRAASSKALIFQVDQSTEALRITSAGNVGIGVADPDVYSLGGNNRFAAIKASAGYTVLNLVDSNNSGSYLQFGNPTVRRGSLHFDSASNFLVTINESGSGTSLAEKLRLDLNGRLTISGQGLKLNPNNSSLYTLDGSLSYYATNNAVYLNGAGTNGWLRLNASGPENNQNAINIFGAGAGAHIDMRTNNAERLRITSAGKIGINQTSPAGQLHIKGNTDESANPSIILDDNGDARRCYVTNTSGDLMLGGIDSGTVQSRLTIHENGNIYHQRLNSSGSLVYQFQAGTSQTGGAASGNTYTEHMAFRQADGMKHGSFTMTIYGDGGDNYMPVLFIRHGYHPTNSSFGGQWFGEMWLNNSGSINPQSYNHTGYNNWATTSFKYRWDCAHWNAKPTMSIIEHHVNYGRTNIADLEISGTQSYFVMWLLPGVYRVTYSAWDGLNAWWTNNNNVGGPLTHREGGGNTTRAVRAYSARDTRYDSNISWGTQGQT